MLDFPTKARPVWIASYPRSGNTFLRILLEKAFNLPTYSIYYVEGDTHRDPSAEALEHAPMLPRDWRQRLTDKENAPPVAIKTHDLPADTAPAVFVARDGRAAIDSYYHYHQKFAFEQPSLTEIIAGACQFGSWSDHYWAWRPKARPNTLLFLYDELVSSPQDAINKLAKFLRLRPSSINIPAFEELQNKQPAFFRRGKNTDFLKEWKPEHLALFNELHASAMADLGFPVTPANAPLASMAKDLAQSAARLHRLYLEQLTNFGRSEANHRAQLEQLEGQLRKYCGEMDQILTPLLRNRWVRLGLALGAVEPPDHEPQEREPAPQSLSKRKA